MQTVFEDLMVMINEGGTWWYLKHHVHDETSNIFKQKMASRDRGPARSDPAIVRALDSLTNVLYFFRGLFISIAAYACRIAAPNRTLSPQAARDVQISRTSRLGATAHWPDCVSCGGEYLYVTESS